MSYKFSTGSIRRGDIYYEDDNVGAQTYIDFGQDTITLRPSGAAILHADEDSVGVGTTTPGATLHVVGGSPNFRVQDSDTNYAFTVDGTVAAGMRWHIGDMDSTQDAFMTMGAYNSINNIDTSIRDFHIYGTNTTTGFYFDESAGKFGIGTTSPDEKLEVAGNLQVAGNDPRIKIDGDTDSHPGLELYENGTRKWIVFNNYTNDNLTFKTNSTTRMSIEQGGDVGIGTTSPQAKLDISGSDSEDIFHVRSDSKANIINVDGSGKIGFGATAPSVSWKAYEFGGAVHIEDASLYFDNDKGIRWGDSSVLINGDATAEQLDIRANSTTYFFLDGDATPGKIGLGTTTPGSTLQASGSIGFNITSFAASANVDETHYTCVGNCGPGGANGSITLTLPSATDAMAGRIYVFKRIDTGGSAPGGSAVIIARNGAYIDGDTDNLQLGIGDCITVQCVSQALGWIILGQYVPV